MRVICMLYSLPDSEIDGRKKTSEDFSSEAHVEAYQLISLFGGAYVMENLLAG